MSRQRITRVEYVLELDGKDYTVRPLSLEMIKEVTKKLEGVSNLPDDADVDQVPGLLDKLVEVCFLVLNRTNSGLTLEKVASMVTVEDINDIIGIGMNGELPSSTKTTESE